MAIVLIATLVVWLGCHILKTHSRLQPALSINTDGILAIRNQKNQPLIEGFELTEFNQGKIVFILKAKQLCLRNRKVMPFGFRVALGKSAELQDVDMTFYLNGEPVSCLHSNKALLDKKRKNIVFQGKPAMLTRNHRVLSAQELKWDNDSRSIQAQGNCVLARDGVNQYAEAITTDIDLNNVTVATHKNKTDFQM
ncbi:MAG: hypothetical protein HY920_06950 [Elusimicrobia bacterium]|nr:hypothetical protein [Elusimicrobiota bacterium]